MIYKLTLTGALVFLLACEREPGELAIHSPAARDTTALTSSSVSVCDDQQDTQSMRECLGAELVRLDSTLTLALDSLMLRGAPRALVDSAQSAFVEFRRLHCLVGASQFEGGTIQPLAVLGCASDVTRQRVSDVQLQYRVP